MKYFILIAHVWNADTSTLEAYIIDHRMSGEDCIFAMVELQPIIKDNVSLSCEFDGATYPD